MSLFKRDRFWKRTFQSRVAATFHSCNIYTVQSTQTEHETTDYTESRTSTNAKLTLRKIFEQVPHFGMYRTILCVLIDCDQEFRSSQDERSKSGTFTSPYFPSNYLPQMQVNQTIITTQSNEINAYYFGSRGLYSSVFFFQDDNWHILHIIHIT